MDKRDFLKTMVGQRANESKTLTTFAPVNNTLAPYTGAWDFPQAAHLLRRTTFGPDPKMIQEAVASGLQKTIESLFADRLLPDPPIYYNFGNDPLVPLGETWVYTAPTQNIQGLQGARRRSLAGWAAGLMHEGGMSIREKMVLFWHEHFPINNINRGQYQYQYINLIRENALGNYRTLVEQITVSPAMLLFLNGDQNSVQAPNENYSRELLELFTIGKGEIAGEGDYTNYTELDVVEMARALTGWRARTTDTGEVRGVYVASRHDTGAKQLSHRFNNMVIENAGVEEYKVVIDIILQQSEVARFISRQLHIWFINADITSEVETNIIEPMAQMIISDNYEIKNALIALLSSEYFFQEGMQGCMINHPYDFLYKIMNGLEVEYSDNLIQKYFLWIGLFNAADTMDMALMSLPSVAGWKAFYQAPLFYEYWINSISLPQREEITNVLLNGVNIGDGRIRIDLLKFISQIEGATDPNVLIDEIAKFLFSFPLGDNQKLYLKEILIPGLPDFEWTIEYGDYLADPENDEVKKAVESKLQNLFSTLLKMPEFYLI